MMHWMYELSAHKMRWCAVIQHNVVKRMGDDLGHPSQAVRDVLDEEKLDGAKEQPANSNGQPQERDAVQKLGRSRMGFKKTEERGIKNQHQGREDPDRHEHHFALQVVTDLDVFLMLVCCSVDFVVVARLEKEMTNLPARHTE